MKYSPNTGLVHRRNWPYVTRGYSDQAGYRKISINYVPTYVHRLAFTITGKNIPKGIVVDHINGDKSDNRIKNLRLVTHRENQNNRAPHRTGKLVGAYYRKAYGIWESQISINKKIVFLGCFKTELEAHEAYVKASKEK